MVKFSMTEAGLFKVRHTILMDRLCGYMRWPAQTYNAVDDWFGQLQKYQEELKGGLGIMVQKKQEDVKWLGYANIDIPASRRDEASQFIADTELFSEALENVISDGYRLSLSLNKTNDTVTCTATCKNKASPNAGYSLTGYGKDWLRATGSLLFKHYRLASEDWTGHTSQNDDEFS